MKSELKEMWKRHREEIDRLRKSCKHEKKFIKIYEDGACVGCGSAYPSVNVVCCNCGKGKIIFGLDSKKRKTVKKTLKRQGFKDERSPCFARHEWEIEK